MISPTRLADFFVEMADTLVDDFDIIDFYHTLTEHAATVSGAAAVGLVLTDHRGHIRFMAASNASAKMLELLQVQTSEGPCVDCVREGQPVVNADLTGAQDRWPTFAPRALQAGIRSVHAFPMKLRDEVIGALNLFRTDDRPFDPQGVRVVQALTDVATIAILQERNLAKAEALTEQLQGAFNSRIVIEQAKGALARSEGVAIQEAFELLRAEARSSHQKLSEVARRVLSDLEKPAGGGGRTPVT